MQKLGDTDLQGRVWPRVVDEEEEGEKDGENERETLALLVW